jgi:hypothetical protein
MINQTIDKTKNIERYEIISTPKIKRDIEDSFYPKISFNNSIKTSPPNLEKEALLIRCLWWIRELYFLQTDALIEASNELKDIVIYHQDRSQYEQTPTSLPAANKILTGEVTTTKISKSLEIEF